MRSWRRRKAHGLAMIRTGRGAFDYRSAEGLMAAKWNDNKCVNLLSDTCGIMPLPTVIWWSKEAHAKITVLCPSLIPAYSQQGGVGLYDMLVHLYKTSAKSRRWSYVLDLCISDSWLVYKKDCGLLNENKCLSKDSAWQSPIVKQVDEPAPEVGRPSSCCLPFQ